MRLPYFRNLLPSNEKSVQQFGGLNEQLVVRENEFADMKNLSGRFYPAIATRKERGVLSQQIASPHGLFYKNGLFYVSGTRAYYNGTQVATVTDTDKQIVGLGAYIVIFPDKIVYNTSDGTLKNMEASFTQSSSATFAPLSQGSVYTKITLTGIGNTFNQYDAVTIAGCTNEAFNGTKVITESGPDYIVVTAKIDEQFTQASGLTFNRSVPDMDFVCERDARIWGCSSENHEVYSCKPGDPFNWNNFEGISTDSYAATVGSDGDFTGVAAYSNYILFFKENAVHILRGDKPSNFSLMEKALPGVRSGCSKSLQVVNDTLFYVGRNGVYAFDGASPQKISDQITQEIASAVACQEDGKYYLSCTLDGSQTILVYDTKYHLWHREDDTEMKFAQFADGHLNYIDGSNYLTTITGSREETIFWYMESGDITESMLGQKWIRKLKFRLWLALNSVATVWIRYDDEAEWHRVCTIMSTKDQTYPVNIIPQRCHKYRWRIEGRGQMKLIGMSREVEGGSEIAHGHFSFGHRR